LKLSITTFWGCTVLLGAASAAQAESGGATLEERRSAIQRGLPYLARQTGAWIEKNKCTSCHQVPHALWAMNEARAQGFDVDSRLGEWNRWSVGFVIGAAEKPESAAERADELSQMLLFGSLADVESEAERDGMRGRLLALLCRGQTSAGGWHAGGQLPDQRRPKDETDEATTMWSLIALRGGGHECGSADPSYARARATVDAASTSLEHLALRYLLAVTGEPDASTAELQGQLLDRQNADGGWGWLLAGESDAIATGQALYALSQVSSRHGRQAVERAQRFLVRTQKDDGSWHAPSTLKKPHDGPSVVADDWGTAWALIGLTRTIER
jgi:squalene-hopene/tetraprenyl-beta-curcumene cyclase